MKLTGGIEKVYFALEMSPICRELDYEYVLISASRM